MKTSVQNQEWVKGLKSQFCVLALIVSISINAQIPNNNWRDHLAYSRGTTLAITPNKVYCAMLSGGMLSYEKSTGEIEKHSKVTGLSDINISAIGYSEDANILVIGYTNGNIDLITSKELINMPYIKEKRITGVKTINKITIYESMAYLACEFGIVAIDLKKREVRDSYFFGANGSGISVKDIAILDNYIYAATKTGLYKADLSAPNLVDFSYWDILTDVPQYNGEFGMVELFNNEIIAVFNNTISKHDELIRITTQGTWEYWNPITDTIIYNVAAYNNQLSILSGQTCYFFSENLNNSKTINITQGRNVLEDTDGTIYAATNSSGSGFLNFKRGDTEGVKLNVTNPRFNTTGFVDTKGDYVWVGSGGPFNMFKQGAAHTYTNEKWRTLSNGYTEGINGIGNFYKFAYHPTIENYVYASAYLYALFEIQDYKVVAKHDRTSVPLFEENISPVVDIRIMDLAFDRKGDLWTVFDEVIQPIYVLRGGKEWEHVPIDLQDSELFSKTNQWRGLLVTKSNQVWILSKSNGMVVLQEQSDGSIREKSFSIVNQEGSQLTKAYCMVEDNDGNVWVGTNKGPIVYTPSNSIFDEDYVKGNQVLLDRNDGSGLGDFLLDYEIINDIAVDGGNRKWLATSTSGVFLVSNDGKKTLQHFTKENSPLISNNVISVGVQEKTGEVFLSTNEGLVAFMGRATEGLEDFSDVYVYPNPIAPEYNGDITISGLIADANVKITDASGNIVYETTSFGGQAVWNGKNFDGARVHSGVYFVFMTDTTGSKKEVTKLVFIH